MPSYDFRCKQCGHKFTARVAIKDKDKVKCEVCGEEVEQLFTGFSMLKSVGTGGGCSAPSSSPFS